MTNVSMERPLVSVIVPSFNQGEFIRETIDSILAQDYRPIEVLIVDGASTDSTVDVLHQFDTVEEITWISEPDSGVVEAVNKGFAMAAGDIAAIQSSDDCYLPGAISLAVSALTGDKQTGLVYGDVAVIDAGGVTEYQTRLAPFSLEAFISNQSWIPQSTCFFRLDLARALNGWREEVPYAADTDLWLRMSFHTDFRKLDHLMATRRKHDAQRDKLGDRVIRDYCKMLDSSKGIAESPLNVRRAAMAGKLMIRNRYGYQDSYAVKLLRQWAVTVIYPKAAAGFPIGSYIPGWWPLRHLLSRVKRSFL